MLSEATIKTIKSTVPVLEEHGREITTRFYKSMFASYPELLNLFNHANQKQGKQQAALANAVYAAAKHIDQLGTILPVVKQIAHKHRSLGVRKEHYPIVGEQLLKAIKDVLGDAATDEIIGAWAEAYGVIAQVFIDVEEEMYKEAEQQQGGWADFRPFVVQRKVVETSQITSFYLVPQDGGPLSTYLPGQYVSIKYESAEEEYSHIRQYSLSDSPGKSYYRITVKREDARGSQPAGKVSNVLHQRIQVGDVLPLSAPAGDFCLDLEDTRPIVLISGGVGLTPLVSMLNALVEAGSKRRIVFIHAAVSLQRHALKDHVDGLVDVHPNLSAYYFYRETAGDELEARHAVADSALDAAWLEQAVPERDAVYYFCGSTPFMRAVKQELVANGVADADMHYEFFGPAGTL